MHAGQGDHDELDKACLRSFDTALVDGGIPADAAVRFSAYFRAETIGVRAYAASPADVPDGLPIKTA